MARLDQPQYISSSGFESRFRVLYNRIFSGRFIADASPFNDPNWELALLSEGINLEQLDFEALASAATLLGDVHLVVTDIETNIGGGALIPWNRDSFEEARASSLLGHVDTAWFGASTNWGAVAYQDDFVCIGGTKKFMDAFADKVGGRMQMMNRFFRYAQNHWLANTTPIERQIKLQAIENVGWKYQR